MVGFAVIPVIVGDIVGADVNVVGPSDGEDVVGGVVGLFVGALVGDMVVGISVGIPVGAGVGSYSHSMMVLNNNNL